MQYKQRIKDNSESISVSASVLAVWLFTTYTNTNPPAEVVIALGTLVGAFAARLKG